MRIAISSVSLVFFLIHLTLAYSLPLFDDEAYYALWARNLDFGYYDHPPMVAYFINLGTILFGETPLGHRFLSVFTVVLSGYLIGKIAARAWPDYGSIGILATSLFHLNCLVFALGGFATPDIPSLFFWVASLWAASFAIQPTFKSKTAALWWAATGVFIGLGILSKFTNAFLAIGLLGYLVLVRQGRSFWATKLPFIGMVCAVLPLMPYILWNVQTDWLGLERQGARLTVEHMTAYHAPEFFALWLLAPTPLVTYFAISALRTSSPTTVFLLFSAVPLTVLFAYYSLYSQIQANWLLPLQVNFILFASIALVRQSKPAIWIRLTVSSAAIICLGFFAVAFNPFTPVGVSDNPPNQTRGWLQTRIEIEDTLRNKNIRWIATTDYALTGMLAFQFPTIEVWSMTEHQRYGFRNPFPNELCEAPALLIERAPLDHVFASKSADLFRTRDVSQIINRVQNQVILMTYHLTPVFGVKSSDLCTARSS